jgi:hypothetical protein
MGTDMVAICIPWRPSAARQPLFEVVRNHYWDTTRFELYTADSDGPVFSRSQAINKAVTAAFEDGHEVAVINDADTLCQILPLFSAIEKTRDDRKSRLPYDKYILMDEPGTRQYFATGELSGGAYEGACSGVLVIHRDTWATLGGFDEAFIGWSMEDVDFGIRHQFERECGTVWSLWHPPEDRTESVPRNLKILRAKHGEHL